MAAIDGTPGNDTLNGTPGDDVINGGAGDDILNGGDGNDVLNGGDGNDTIDGGPGIDTLSFATATQGIDLVLVATAPRNTGQGFDSIVNVENVVGSDFKDYLEGTADANQINGAAGDDTIVGGGGADLLTGGSGNDWFIYGPGDGADAITDLTAGDHIFLEGYSSPQSVTQVGSDVVIVYSATDQITCLNTDVATVEAALPHPSTFTQPPSAIIPLLPTRPASTTATGR